MFHIVSERILIVNEEIDGRSPSHNMQKAEWLSGERPFPLPTNALNQSKGARR
jgi:hypothetical protein